MALDEKGAIVAAREVHSTMNQHWSCHHCKCPLIFRLPTRTSPPWFEHDLTRGDPVSFLHSPYLAPESGHTDRVARFKRLLNQLPAVDTTTHWHCTMCVRHYEGTKFCSLCKTGIYSKETR
ncbi:zinc-ribbon domain-containing protein [Kosakonia sp. R1.Fl]|uniref:zinc-ribbon domain-containing protein n=1 Tax=Kosakonia sp. R1.Fl TaxID=2928706 RepID=UPI00201D6246|nr:zinc-ribbon domain-containing protein [Kosakonia sp. R1.Fl]MCL6742293.1 zinc-ribbon domain-containing protein [Kosakonia sp. R1.Fl]